jgi:hypothetical protein
MIDAIIQGRDLRTGMAVWCNGQWQVIRILHDAYTDKILIALPNHQCAVVYRWASVQIAQPVYEEVAA